jgi:hypothetical protein
VARHAATDPILIACLVKYAIDAIALADLERILDTAGARLDVDRAVQRALATEWRPGDPARSLRGELMLAFVEIERTRRSGPASYDESLKEVAKEGGIGSTPPLAPEYRRDWGSFVDRTEAVIIHNLRTVIANADRPYPEARAALDEVVTRLNQHSDDAAYTSARILFPVYVEVAAKHAKSLAKIATLDAAASLFSWRARHGAFPPNLGDAMTKVPRDPFDGRAIRYRRTADGFIVYSVGPTGTFDGGTQSAKPASNEVVYRFPMPAYVK